jgi:cardiolipin synthase A/B
VQIVIHKDQCGVMFERGGGTGQSMFHKGRVRIRDMMATMLMRVAYPSGLSSFVRQKPNEVAEKLQAHPNVLIECRPRYDHSKVYIFDGETLIMGGVNVSDAARHDLHDYMVEMKSKLLVGRFLSRLEGRERDEIPVGASLDFFFNVTRRLRGRKREVGDIMRQMMDGAQREIMIQMAYFGDRRLTNAIVAAAKRGVQIAILTSERSDVQHDLNHHILRDILRRSPPHAVRIYLSRATHAKLLHVDRSRTFIGSANMNVTGTRRLGESNLYVNDGDGSADAPQSPFTKALREQLMKDMQASKRVDSPHQLKVHRLRAWLEGRAVA